MNGIQYYSFSGRFTIKCQVVKTFPLISRIVIPILSAVDLVVLLGYGLKAIVYREDLTPYPGFLKAHALALVSFLSLPKVDMTHQLHNEGFPSVQILLDYAEQPDQLCAWLTEQAAGVAWPNKWWPESEFTYDTDAEYIKKWKLLLADTQNCTRLETLYQNAINFEHANLFKALLMYSPFSQIAGETKWRTAVSIRGVVSIDSNDYSSFAEKKDRLLEYFGKR